MRQATETNASALYDLYEQEGGLTDVVRDALDKLVIEIAFTDPEYTTNANKLRDRRTKDDEAREIVARQRATVDNIRRTIIIETGLPTDEFKTELERAQIAVRERLGEGDVSQMDSDRLLRELGIIQESEDGKDTFTYPRDLFPEGTNEKWDLYVLSVENHLRTARDVQSGYAPRAELEHVDAMRRFAHNRIASDVGKILGFEALPDEEWDFEKTRRLVAKMREHKFAGKETDEVVITNTALARGLGQLGLSVLDTLAAKKRPEQ
jgi:hypothetical protein